MVGLLSFVAICFIAFDYFSPSARRRRKRKKSYQRLIARARRPMATFTLQSQKNMSDKRVR